MLLKPSLTALVDDYLCLKQAKGVRKWNLGVQHTGTGSSASFVAVVAASIRSSHLLPNRFTAPLGSAEKAFLPS
jgi:hypothetical protein